MNASPEVSPNSTRIVRRVVLAAALLGVLGEAGCVARRAPVDLPTSDLPAGSTVPMDGGRTILPPDEDIQLGMAIGYNRRPLPAWDAIYVDHPPLPWTFPRIPSGTNPFMYDEYPPKLHPLHPVCPDASFGAGLTGDTDASPVPLTPVGATCQPDDLHAQESSNDVGKTNTQMVLDWNFQTIGVGAEVLHQAQQESVVSARQLTSSKYVLDLPLLLERTQPGGLCDDPDVVEVVREVGWGEQILSGAIVKEAFRKQAAEAGERVTGIKGGASHEDTENAEDVNAHKSRGPIAFRTVPCPDKARQARAAGYRARIRAIEVGILTGKSCSDLGPGSELERDLVANAPAVAQIAGADDDITALAEAYAEGVYDAGRASMFCEAALGQLGDQVGAR